MLTMTMLQCLVCLECCYNSVIKVSRNFRVWSVLTCMHNCTPLQLGCGSSRSGVLCVGQAENHQEKIVVVWPELHGDNRVAVIKD